MAAARLLAGIAFFTALLCIATASQNTIADSNTDRKGKKKVDDMVNDMYTAFMMTKNVMSMMLMFVSPIIQIKGFGLSVMNTLINIGRFLLQMQATRRLQEMTEMNHVAMMPQVFHEHADHKIAQSEQREPLKHHDDHGNPVYIITDHPDHDSWGDGHDNHDHNLIWDKDPVKHWKSSEHYFSAPDHDQKWSSSQQLGYYAPAPTPTTRFSDRLGLPASVPHPQQSRPLRTGDSSSHPHTIHPTSQGFR